MYNVMNIMNSSDELAGLPFPIDGSTVLAVPTDLRREGGSFVFAVLVSLKSQLRFVLAVANLALSPFFFFFSGFSSPHSCEFVFVFVYMISEREK